MSLQHLGKATLRIAKNYTKGYSDVQAKVRDATSNDPWGPTGTQMNEIAQMTYNQNDFVEIMEMLDKRLNDKGKNWRHVFKALTLIDYLLHSGSENVVIYFRDNLYVIKTLKEFQYVDEYQKDVGANVRQKAKDITNLLMDESRLREERRSRAGMRDRMTKGGGEFDEEEDLGRRSRQTRQPGPSAKGGKGDDEELKRAIEASKRSLAEEQARAAEDRDLEAAIKLSKEEEELRKKSIEDANQRSLFDDQAQVATAPTNNPFPLIDPTGFGQQLQPQYTQMIVPQFTSFNPYAQQAAQEQMQQQYLLQQQEWLRQQQEQQLLQAQAQAQQEEWNRQQQLLLMQQQQQQQQFQAAQPLYPQQTAFGTNNPFAAVSPAPQSPPVSSTVSTTSTLDSFSLPSTFSHSPAPNLSTPTPSTSATSPSPGPAMQRPTRSDGEHAHLANLLANREDGLDTFGNTGLLRFGHTNAGRVAAQKTGHNPFAPQQQQQQSEQPFFSI